MYYIQMNAPIDNESDSVYIDLQLEAEDEISLSRVDVSPVPIAKGDKLMNVKLIQSWKLKFDGKKGDSLEDYV